MRTKGKAKPPRRPRVITARLVVVSLVVGVVLAVVSVPVGVVIAERGPAVTSRLKAVEFFVHEETKAYYVRHVQATSTQWTGFEYGIGSNPPTQSRGLSPKAFAQAMGASLVPSSPLPGRTRAAFAGRMDTVEYHEVGWPWRVAWGVHGSVYQPASSTDVGLSRIAAFGDVWLVPYLPLWPGLLGNTLFYAVLMLTPLALLRWRRLRCRTRRGLCAACGYELGEGSGACPACPECGLAKRGS